MDVLNVSDADIMNTVNPPMPDNADEVVNETNSAAEDGNSETQDDESSSKETTDLGTDKDGASDGTAEDDAEVLAAAQLQKLYAPFNANGKEIKIDNIDDAIRLMQMGAGFNKKMATLKPHLKIVKMLQNNDLLDEGKLSHLIDISKKNPAAISKLLAESNIDPLNLDSGNEYTPNTYTVNDSELELDDVLAELKDSPHYTQTLDVVVNKWDDTSKKLLISNPPIIRILHEQMSNGIYEQVTQVMERERALGRLTGLSDLEAYKQVGDDMNAKGLFKAPEQKSTATSSNAPKAGTNTDSELKSRKLAASPTKASPGKKPGVGNFNPLTATDDEIKNMTFDKFL